MQCTVKDNSTQFMVASGVSGWGKKRPQNFTRLVVPDLTAGTQVRIIRGVVVRNAKNNNVKLQGVRKWCTSGTFKLGLGRLVV